MVSGLELFSTQELIDEIFNRTTFVGVLIHLPDEQKFADQVHQNINVYTTTDRSGTINLLEYGTSAVSTDETIL